MVSRLNFIYMSLVAILIITGREGTEPRLIALAQSTDATSTCLDYDPNLDKFNISPDIPPDAYDFDSEECSGQNDPKPPKDDSDGIKLQRVYDIFSWESFLATNWPIDDQGNPQAKLTDPGSPQWTTWKESYEIFKADGTEPSDWGAPRTLPLTTAIPPLPSLPNPTDKNTRILFTVNQAVSDLPLWDQNGNMVYYEMLMNQEEFEQVKNLQFYNLEGQTDYYGTVGPLLKLPPWQLFEFPWGTIATKEIGSMELKLAWKIIDKEDISSRFYTMDAYVLVFQADENQWAWEQKKVGLVGMHIIHKTASSRNWVWSTFEHVDNVGVNDLEVLKYGEKGEVLKPSFTNPYSATLPVNILPEPDAQGIQRTQVMRITPIPQATEVLNGQVQEQLKTYKLLCTITPQAIEDLEQSRIPESLPASCTENGFQPSDNYLLSIEEEGSKWQVEDEGQTYAIRLVEGQLNVYEGSIWQYYQLVGTQYVTDPTAFPTEPDQGLPESITNISGGKPAPAYLVNSVIETYFQQGNQQVSTPGQYSPNQIETTVFETESCMGCHFSAGLTVAKVVTETFRLPGTANFSYLLQKANSMEVLLSIPTTSTRENQLDNHTLPQALIKEFNKKGVGVSSNDAITIEKVNLGSNIIIADKWLITISQLDREQKYIVRREDDELNVYILKK